ncbi:MAG: hypothetical protein H0T42_26615 [Deltaproteobacteria bacterium]|nr:hypothetical protein [Deltaproteobacteria bacterium]
MANPETSKTAPSSTPFPTLPTFDPMAMWAQSQQTFTKLMTDSVARWQAFGDQYASVEAQVASHAQTAMAQWSQLAKDAIAYGQQLSVEARKLTVETAKKMGVPA